IRRPFSCALAGDSRCCEHRAMTGIPHRPSKPACVQRPMADAFVEALASDAGRLAESARQGVLVTILDLADWCRFQDEAPALLDEAEVARARRQRNPRNRDALVLTYALHRLLLSNVLRCAPGEVGVRRDDKGCPRLPGGAWHTSLSHSADRVA